MHTHHTQRGYSFIEVLVSVSILLIAIVGPLTIASKGLQNAYFARQQNTAFFLAQEGIEGVHDLHSRWGLYALQNNNFSTSWNWANSTQVLPAACTDGVTACGITLNSGSSRSVITPCTSLNGCVLYHVPPSTSASRYPYRHGSGSTNLSPYTRKLYFEPIVVGGEQAAIRVRSEVTWRANTFGADRSVEVETYLYDFYRYELNI